MCILMQRLELIMDNYNRIDPRISKAHHLDEKSKTRYL